MARYGRDYDRGRGGMRGGMGGGGGMRGGWGDEDELRGGGGSAWGGGEYGGMRSDAYGAGGGWEGGYRRGMSEFGPGGGAYDQGFGEPPGWNAGARGGGGGWESGGEWSGGGYPTGMGRGYGGGYQGGGWGSGGGREAMGDRGYGGGGMDDETGGGYGRPGGRSGGGGRGMRGGSGRGGQDETRRLRAADIMTESPECVTGDVSLAEAACKMRDLDVGIIPVVESESNRRLKGVLTDRDITVRAVAEGMDARSTRVADVMTTDVETCNKNDLVSDVLDVMRREQVRRVPITDRDGRLVGIVAQADVVLDIDSHRGEHRVQDTLERISEPAGRGRGGATRGSQGRGGGSSPGGGWNASGSGSTGSTSNLGGDESR
ncbi:MAG TPA: CBS domain-containing protein [Longimicrobiaceae bacterium]|nr:CBS domain-containing protein [Longimicrobiaceae bacterium]